METVQSLYETYSYPNPRNYKLNPKGETFYISSAAPQATAGKRILVAGCGCAEAIMVANANPQSIVVGVDFSETSIKHAKSIARKYNITNVSLFVGDIADIELADNQPKFDYVVSTGVIHHIPDVKAALNTIRRVISDEGRFSGMVYSDRRPSFIRRLNRLFRERNYTVEDVRNYFDNCPYGELPAANWYFTHDRADEEIADTWLHPHFVEYSPQSLQQLLQPYFKHVAAWYAENDETKLMFYAVDNICQKDDKE